MSIESVKEIVLKLKTKILDIEKANIKLSETDTRQGLINPLFSALGWDFSDFNSVKSELRHKSYNEPVDYAFFSEKNNEKPILLAEAKALGVNLNSSKIVKQICTYLGEMGTQWGVLSDGNKYIMYNSRGGDSFQDQRFLTLQIKDVDTEDGLSADDLAEKFVALLSKNCLENDNIQKTYEEHMINGQLTDALYSLLSSPFETLVGAIHNEFKKKQVKANSNLKITKKRIVQFLQQISDEEGRLPIDFEAGEASTDDEVMVTVAKIDATEGLNQENSQGKVRKTKRITISDLLQEDMVYEGDTWKFDYKGEITWGRITGNGELEVDGSIYSSPSEAARKVSGHQSRGWHCWKFKSLTGEWFKVNELRSQYRDTHGLERIRRAKKSSPKTST